MGVGDNANGANAQSLRNLKGKMLRINKDGTIPQDNPFYERATGRDRAIWALGLRNPFSFAIQPSTSKMFINDVGEGRWEEINRGVAGANYGWPRYEGPESDPRYRNPVFAYRHGSTNTTGCAITGRRLLQSHHQAVPEWLRRRLLLCGPLQRVDKEARFCDRSRLGVRYWAKQARRSQGEQGR